MIDLTVNIEPQTRGGINPHTGEYCRCKVDGFEGSIIIMQQNPPIGMPSMLEWRHIQADTMREVAEKQLLMLNALKDDIDKMIAKIKID